MVDQRGRAQIPAVDQVQVDALANDAGIVRDGRADDVRGEDQGRVLAELRVDVFLRQFDAVSLDAREANLTGVRSGVMARTGTVSRGFGCLAATGWAVKSNGMPSTSAYSTLNRPSSFRS